MTLSQYGVHVEGGTLGSTGDVGIQTTASANMTQSVNQLADALKATNVVVSGLLAALNTSGPGSPVVNDLVQQGVISSYAHTGLNCDMECRITPVVDYLFADGLTDVTYWCETSGQQSCTAPWDRCNATGQCARLSTVYTYVLFLQKTSPAPAGGTGPISSQCTTEGNTGLATGGLGVTAWFPFLTSFYVPGDNLQQTMDQGASAAPPADAPLSNHGVTQITRFVNANNEFIGYWNDEVLPGNMVMNPAPVPLLDADGAASLFSNIYTGVGLGLLAPPWFVDAGTNGCQGWSNPFLLAPGSGDTHSGGNLAAGWLNTPGGSSQCDAGVNSASFLCVGRLP